jgi:hypothetical protein
MLIIAVILTLPAQAQQEPVAPTGTRPDMVGRSAHADPARGISATTATSTSAKPFTQDQVQGLVRDGLGDESGAKLIEQRGINFAPTEGFLQNLKAAGASEAFLKALRAAKPPEPASAKKPINQVQIITLLGASPPKG